MRNPKHKINISYDKPKEQQDQKCLLQDSMYTAWILAHGWWYAQLNCKNLHEKLVTEAVKLSHCLLNGVGEQSSCICWQFPCNIADILLLFPIQTVLTLAI